MKTALNLVSVYKTVDSLINDSITDNTMTSKASNDLMNVRGDIHDCILDAVNNLTVEQSNEIFSKLADIRGVQRARTERLA